MRASHKAQAEDHLQRAKDVSNYEEAAYLVALAQVHATLALVEATQRNRPGYGEP